MDGTLAAGRAQLEAGNPEGAVRAAKQVLMDDPQDTEALALLSNAHMVERDYRSAQDVISSWLRIDPNDPDAHSMQIALQMSLGRQDDAKQRIQQFSASFPQEAYQSLWLEALWEEAFGSPEKAAERYEALLETAPDSIDTKMRLAMAHAEGRNVIAARRLSMEVLSQDMSNAEALRTAAIGALKAFNLSDARDLANSARAANPRDMAMKKVHWASWLVLFPPFLAGHLLQMLLSNVRHSAGNVAANILGGIVAATMAGTLIYAGSLNDNYEPIPLETSLILTTVFLACGWALSMYYIFGVGNADEDRKTTTVSGGY